MTEYCCEEFESSVNRKGIRKFMNKWISDIVISREDKSTFSEIYNIEAITFLVYKYCPFCGNHIHPDQEYHKRDELDRAPN